jgi:hypothetical protein
MLRQLGSSNLCQKRLALALEATGKYNLNAANVWAASALI